MGHSGFDQIEKIRVLRLEDTALKTASAALRQTIFACTRSGIIAALQSAARRPCRVINQTSNLPSGHLAPC